LAFADIPANRPLREPGDYFLGQLAIASGHHHQVLEKFVAGHVWEVKRSATERAKDK
jgi:hypothetical protein